MLINEFTSLNKAMQYMYKEFVESKYNKTFFLSIDNKFRPLYINILFKEIRDFFSKTRIEDIKQSCLYGSSPNDYEWECSNGGFFVRLGSKYSEHIAGAPNIKLYLYKQYLPSGVVKNRSEIF